MSILSRVEMFTIPDSLKAALRHSDNGALTIADDRGQAHVLIKLPQQEIRLLGGPLPIIHFMFMFPMPTAPVVGWIIEIMDSPQNPLRIGTYFNILDPGQARNLKAIARQRVVPLHFVHGDCLSIVTTKRIMPPRDIAKVFLEAVAYAGTIPPGKYDFKVAKVTFRAKYSLSDIMKWWLS